MITRRAFAGAIAAVALASRLTPAAEVARAQNVVLVHGLFADGSCWSEVILRLRAADRCLSIRPLSRNTTLS